MLLTNGFMASGGGEVSTPPSGQLVQFKTLFCARTGAQANLYTGVFENGFHSVFKAKVFQPALDAVKREKINTSYVRHHLAGG